MGTKAAEELNEQLFAKAVKSLKQMEPVWQQQLEMLLGHKAKLELDFDGLGGNYSLVQPFIHQGLTGALEGLGLVAFDPVWRKKLEGVKGMVIAPAKKGAVSVKGGKLTVKVALQETGRAPT